MWLLYVRTTRPNIGKKNICLLPTGCMSVIYMAVGTYCCHLATDWLFFCLRDGVCLLRGTNLIFKYNAGQFLCRTEWQWDRFSSVYICFPPVSIIPPVLPAHLYVHGDFNRSTNGKSLGTFQKAKVYRKSGNMDQKSFFTFVSCKGFTAVKRFIFVKKI